MGGLTAIAALVVLLVALAFSSKLELAGDAAVRATKDAPLLATQAASAKGQYGSLDLAAKVSLLATERVPVPAPRLPKCGASFVVPVSRFLACEQCELTIGITAWPDLWPIHASLWRPRAGGPWARLDLRVDFITATDMPPFFSCQTTGSSAAPGTGGNEDRLGACACAPGGSGDGWLEVVNSSGILEGTIHAQSSGCCKLLRKGQEPWSIEVRSDGDRWVIVRRKLQELAITTWHRKGGMVGNAKGPDMEEFLQVDVEPEHGERDSILLLLVVLAMAAFRQGVCVQ